MRLLIVLSLAWPRVRCQLHFVSLGGWGSGSSVQLQVANTLKQKVKTDPVTLIISPGSNFVSGGVQEFNDTKWYNDYIKVYSGAELEIPLYTVLGLDDWKGNYTALAIHSNDTFGIHPKIPKWTLPNWWYHYILTYRVSTGATPAYQGQDASVGFVFIDTTILADDFPFPEISRRHWDEMRATLETAKQIVDWLIVVGDKTLISSGTSKGDRELRRTLRPLLKEHNADAYISGSDPNLEIIEDGPLDLINCGSGGRADPIKLRMKAPGSKSFHASSGFCVHTLTDREMVTELIDGDSGAVLATHTRQKTTKPMKFLNRFNLFQNLPKVQYVPIPSFVMSPVVGEDEFVKVIGSIGLVIAAFVLGVGGITGVSSLGHSCSK